MQAIILCGGKGTRLKGALPDGMPKAMAFVSGRPFLCYLLEYWEQYVDRFILATGYGDKKILDYFGYEFCKEITYSSSVYGTAEAVRVAMERTTSSEIFVINGDTYWEVDPLEMLAAHRKADVHMTLGYSSEAGIHAGVDILEVRPRHHTRGAIFTHSGYFTDIGTPETLAKFREHIKNEATSDL